MERCTRKRAVGEVYDQPSQKEASKLSKFATSRRRILKLLFQIWTNQIVKAKII